MRGIIFALVGGACITLQGVANSRISADIGTWQTAALTQFTGFIVSLFILLLIKEKKWKNIRRVKPLYAMGGALGAIVIFSNVTAIQQIGVTLTIAALLIAQLSTTFLIESNGWCHMSKKKIQGHHFIGIIVMIAGVVILKI